MGIQIRDNATNSLASLKEVENFLYRDDAENSLDSLKKVTAAYIRTSAVNSLDSLALVYLSRRKVLYWAVRTTNDETTLYQLDEETAEVLASAVLEEGPLQSIAWDGEDSLYLAFSEAGGVIKRYSTENLAELSTLTSFSQDEPSGMAFDFDRGDLYVAADTSPNVKRLYRIQNPESTGSQRITLNPGTPSSRLSSLIYYDNSIYGFYRPSTSSVAVRRYDIQAGTFHNVSDPPPGISSYRHDSASVSRNGEVYSVYTPVSQTNPPHARVYKSTDIDTMDTSALLHTIALNTGAIEWADGVPRFEIEPPVETFTGVYLLNTDDNKAYAFDMSFNRAEEENDLTLPSGNWGGIAANSTRIYVLPQAVSSDTPILVYDHGGVRQPTEDITVEIGDVNAIAVTDEFLFVGSGHQIRRLTLSNQNPSFSTWNNDFPEDNTVWGLAILGNEMYFGHRTSSSFASHTIGGLRVSDGGYLGIGTGAGASSQLRQGIVALPGEPYDTVYLIIRNGTLRAYERRESFLTFITTDLSDDIEEIATSGWAGGTYITS